MADLSVLIPIFNQDVTQLVHELHQQCQQLQLLFEIRCYDDGSRQEIKETNRQLNELPGVRYLELKHNIGRAAIRNLMAQEARYSHLLFLDNDCLIADSDFIQNYVKYSDSAYDAISGGTIYKDQKPPVNHLLRWKYGRAKEQRSAAERSRNPFRSFTLNNLFIKKDVYLRYRLDESLLQYGHEDTKFGVVLERAGVRLLHIENPVIHIGLETAEIFLQKTKQAIANLFQLYAYEGLCADTNLVKTYLRLKRMGLVKTYLRFFLRVKRKVMHNLHSAHPSLFWFDMYKLYLFALYDTTAIGPTKNSEPIIKKTAK
ncbi:MAG: glycosyltransferase [Hymenobacteraceae bacterium]|nr:glycosyltransferase [Hymenobacteraceae bacterium]MDX5397960.1 glycosyltransferase [Hymenobacteraceae bacterium]MDX5514032.1 glycosyltransferase [Hymenobacteraceae bacterium]